MGTFPFQRSSIVIGVITGFAILQGCAPTPRHTLTAEEKAADMQWIYSQFGENYAPLNLKEKLYGFKYADLKEKYLAEAAKTQTNAEFYAVMYRFVAEFRDAHTSGSLTNSPLPGRADVAYLGFKGARKGDSLVVTELLPTINSKSSAYPIKVGDEITKLDGTPLKEVILNEMVKYRDLGQEQSNLTYHMNKLFSRLTTANGLPEKATATLTVLRNKKEEQVVLPWVLKDLKTFTEEQAAAEKALKAQKARNESGHGEPLSFDAQANAWSDSALSWAHKGSVTAKLSLNPPADKSPAPSEKSIYDLILEVLNGDMNLLNMMANKFTHTHSGSLAHILNTFVFMDTMPMWNSDLPRHALGMEGVESSVAEMKKQRQVPEHILWVPEATVYPTYIKMETLKDKAGKDVKTALVAYMYLNTFSPGGNEDTVVKEVASTLETLKQYNVNNLVIDMLNNGGGSLTLGMRLGQILSREKITLPGMQLRLSDSWLDEFESVSLEGNSDTERYLAKQVFQKLVDAKKTGTSRLSETFDGETLAPYTVKPNADLDQRLNVVLMVNEMCASMCDIFTAMLKDNGMATVVGTKTMGAGGNVVAHFQAPNSHFIVNQTESLVVRKDGSYVENAGVDPDVAIAVNESSSAKYEPVRLKAVETVLSQAK